MFTKKYAIFFARPYPMATAGVPIKVNINVTYVTIYFMNTLSGKVTLEHIQGRNSLNVRYVQMHTM